MAALPPISEFTGSGVTEGDFKTALSDLRGFLAGLLGAGGTSAEALAALGAVGAGVLSKSGDYTVAQGDRGRLIESTAALTLSLPEASTVGAGFAFVLANSASGDVVLDPYASEQIDGATSLTVVPGGNGLIMCTGTAWLSALNNIPVERGTYTPSLIDMSGNSVSLSPKSITYVRIGAQATVYFNFMTNLDTTGLVATDDVAVTTPFVNTSHSFSAAEVKGLPSDPGPYLWYGVSGMGYVKIRNTVTHAPLTVADLSSGVTDIVGGAFIQNI